MADPFSPYAGMSRWRRRYGRRTPAFGLVFSLLLIFGGVALFLDSLAVIRLHELWGYWPIILIALGLAKISGADSYARRSYGGLLIFAGALFLIVTLGIVPLSPGTVVPMVLIGCGVVLLVNQLQRRDAPDGAPGAEPEAAATITANMLHELAVFAGSKHRVYEQKLEGGDLASIFGSIELDLRNANMAPPSGPITLDTTAIFGAIELRVPETWVIAVHGMAIFGAFEDKTVPPRPAAGTESPRLVLTGLAMFGAVTIQN